MTSCTPFEDDVPLRRGVACDPTADFGAPRLVPGLADAGATVDGVHLSPDGLVAYFDALGGPYAMGGSDLYAASRGSVDAPFESVFSLAALNTAKEEAWPTVTADGSLIVFQRAMNEGIAPSHLYSATRFGPFWFDGVAPLGINGADGLDETPFLVPSGAALYFGSTRGGAHHNLYVARRSGADFAQPSSLDELNGPFESTAPVTSPDELTIYFGSDRPDPGALGNSDVFVATRSSALLPFTAVKDVRQVNSQAFDVPTYITEDGCSLYLSSTRDGSLLTYVATKPPPRDAGTP